MIMSNKLLGEALGVNVLNSQSLLSDIEYEFKEHSGIYTHKKNINVYELCFNLKEMAYNKGFALIVKFAPLNTCVYIQNVLTGENLTFFNKKTEVECIIKACQWVLDKEG